MIANKEKICQLAKEVIATEAQALISLHDRVDDNFYKACQYLLECKNRIVVLGMGKSGHIGSKLAATFASTGSPAFFVHPGEASHGDIGMIAKDDLVMAISNSGNTPELLTILPFIKKSGITLITLTGNPNSTLAQAANVNLDISVPKEACPLGLAPTASTTAALAMGDALAIALLEARGFTAQDFAQIHPGGILGKRLLLSVDDLMRRNEAVPKVTKNTPIVDALIEMSQKHLGMTTVIDEETGDLLGIFTDGDLRRALDNGFNVHDTKISEVMTLKCKTIPAGTLAIEALKLMEQHKITTLIILSDLHIPVGIIHLHDLLKAGLT